MNQVNKLSGLAMASAAATLLLSGVNTASAAAHEKATPEIKCSGINLILLFIFLKYSSLFNLFIIEFQKHAI